MIGARARNQAADRATAERLRAKLDVDLVSSALAPIPEDVTLLEWVTMLSEERIDPVTGETRPALKVDGQPFSLKDRPTLAWVFSQVPSTREEAFRRILTLRKCAQVGFTVMEMLVVIFFALKFEGVKVGMYVPDMSLARIKSANRFMRIVRLIPEAYALLLRANGEGSGRRCSEGNVMTRLIGESTLYFLWTSGKATTESYPMDIITFDEVQEMRISDMEKVRERVSASSIKFTLMGSTANWPGADIDWWYGRGSQHRFHTRCPECGVEEPLDDYFPQCIKFDPTFPDRVRGVPGDYRYVCRAGHWIDDPQAGTWIPDNPSAISRREVSIHFHQMLSPTISPREMYEAFINADDMKNFYNRKLGKPYQDPNEVPVTLAHLQACVEAGAAAGIVWKRAARDTIMGIDQMGGFNVVIIKERLPDGRQSVIHVEEIYGEDPFDRCSQLMKQYGVRVCVVEQLPNFNCALSFANRHPGRVFLCNGYGKMDEGYVSWGDAGKLDASQRRTDADAQARYTVRIDQYKAMDVSLRRFTAGACLLPDPQALTQEVIDKGHRRNVAVLKDRVFVHLTNVALVTERRDPRERNLRASVRKIGLDPHFAFANMLCDVAYVRAYGTATFILPDIEPSRDVAAELGVPGLPAAIAHTISRANEGAARRCGECAFYLRNLDQAESSHRPPFGECSMFNVERKAMQSGCDHFGAEED